MMEEACDKETAFKAFCKSRITTQFSTRPGTKQYRIAYSSTKITRRTALSLLVFMPPMFSSRITKHGLHLRSRPCQYMKPLLRSLSTSASEIGKRWTRSCKCSRIKSMLLLMLYLRYCRILKACEETYSGKFGSPSSVTSTSARSASCSSRKATSSRSIKDVFRKIIRLPGFPGAAGTPPAKTSNGDGSKSTTSGVSRKLLCGWEISTQPPMEGARSLDSAKRKAVECVDNFRLDAGLLLLLPLAMLVLLLLCVDE
mmetsp:Transcript_115043/g.245729  ORF Transcript_115043/g.245729 Transcript_115043/m.245729 type:complete len:256 (+) Transcript_115043:699-1466(+)